MDLTTLQFKTFLWHKAWTQRPKWESIFTAQTKLDIQGTLGLTIHAKAMNKQHQKKNQRVLGRLMAPHTGPSEGPAFPLASWVLCAHLLAWDPSDPLSWRSEWRDELQSLQSGGGKLSWMVTSGQGQSHCHRAEASSQTFSRGRQQSDKLGTTKCPSIGDGLKKSIVHPYNGVSFRNSKESSKSLYTGKDAENYLVFILYKTLFLNLCL